MGGIVFAGMVSNAFSGSKVWQGATVLLPVAVLGYLYSLSRMPTVAAVSSQSNAARVEEEELVDVGSLHSHSRR
jgi:cell division septal protein FtsQ